MKFLLLTELYDPVVGGPVTYARETCRALAAQGHELTLVAPGTGAKGGLSIQETDFGQLLQIGIDHPMGSEYPRHLKYYFTEQVNRHLPEWATAGRGEAVHILYGAFLTEKLDLAYLRRQGIPAGTTVHNVPPAECSTSWREDAPWRYWKDRARKLGVRWINKRRLTAQRFDRYVTPSRIVRELLRTYLPEVDIHVIGHGGQPVEPQLPRAYDDGLKILTVGGLVPHKNQHLIPSIGAELARRGIEFQWDIIGPPRNDRYARHVADQIARQKMTERVHLRGAVDNATLAEAHRTANLFVQPSSEEGFCMTALDAAFCGLPLIGAPAGAIPEIIADSAGIPTEALAGSLADAIAHFAAIPQEFQSSSFILETLTEKYSWSSAVNALTELYAHG